MPKRRNLLEFVETKSIIKIARETELTYDIIRY